MRLALLAFYGGPDQVMTVTSGLASILGLLLIFWNKVTASFFKVWNRIRGNSPSAASQASTKTPPEGAA